MRVSGGTSAGRGRRTCVTEDTTDVDKGEELAVTANDRDGPLLTSMRCRSSASLHWGKQQPVGTHRAWQVWLTWCSHFHKLLRCRGIGSLRRGRRGDVSSVSVNSRAPPYAQLEVAFLSVLALEVSGRPDVTRPHAELKAEEELVRCRIPSVCSATYWL